MRKTGARLLASVRPSHQVAKASLLIRRSAMENRWCTACGQAFRPSPKVPRQSYCSDPDCQRERRRLWQQARRRSDPDYLDNQEQAQRAWSKRHPDYWRAYRAAHPDYVDRNRQLQSERNEKKPPPAIAKMDEFTIPILLPTGIYHLEPIRGTGIAKKNVWTVQITVLSVAKQ